MLGLSHITPPLRRLECLLQLQRFHNNSKSRERISNFLSKDKSCSVTILPYPGSPNWLDSEIVDEIINGFIRKFIKNVNFTEIATIIFDYCAEYLSPSLFKLSKGGYLIESKKIVLHWD